MYIHIDLEANEPIYTQIKDQIIAGIAKKSVKPGEALPSVRSMASDLGINLHTVNKAYRQLKQEGFILIHRQKGVVVNPDGIPQADEGYKAGLKNTLHPLVADSICRGVTEEEFLQICSRLYHDFTQERGDR